MPQLIVIKGANHGQRLQVQAPKTVLGRDKTCDIVLDSTEVVSRRHALIALDDGKYYIEDGDGKGQKSRNGTFVNDERIPFPDRVPLKANDVIRICDFSFVYDDGDTLAEDAASSSSIDGSVSHDSSSVFLSQPAEKLQLLLEISNRLSHGLEMDPILPQIVESLLQLFKQARRGFLFLVDETTGEPVQRVIKTRRAEDAGHSSYDTTFVKQCLRTVQGLLSFDVAKSADGKGESMPRSVMCAPLWTRDDKAFGALMVDSQNKKKKFTQEDLTLLMGVASQASIALVNAQLHSEALVRERLNRDLALAREVQRSFLPASVPEIAAYEFFARNESAQAVGGDYYDFIPLGGGKLGILLGDVAGKGVAAALVMARFSAEARAALRAHANLAAAVRALDDLMLQLNVTDRFVTLAAVVLEPATNTITVVNAGHPSPLILRRGTHAIEEATSKADVGPPLGVLDDYEYASRQMTLGPGDEVVLYSDGVTDAMNAKGAQLGPTKLRSVLTRSHAGPSLLGERILKAVKDHAAGCDQHDDITLVCFGRRE